MVAKGAWHCVILETVQQWLRFRQDGTPVLFYGVPSTQGVCAQTPWRTAANSSDLSTKRHITGSPVDKVPNGLEPSSPTDHQCYTPSLGVYLSLRIFVQIS